MTRLTQIQGAGRCHLSMGGTSRSSCKGKIREENNCSHFCKQSSTPPNVIVSFTAYPAGGPVAGTPSEVGRSLFYKTALTVAVFFITMPLNDVESHRTVESQKWRWSRQWLSEGRFLYRKPQEACNFQSLVPILPLERETKHYAFKSFKSKPTW